MVAVAIGSVSGAAVVAPAVVEAHEAGTNGCSFSPDVGYVPVYYDFHRSCDRHDLCYVAKPFGASSAGRAACDDAFRADMKAWCNGYYNAWYAAPARALCRGVADTYYAAVRTFGAAFF